MLVLTRKNKQSVIFRNTETGEVVTVRVDGICKSKIRMIIDAPQKYEIKRDEVELKKQK